MRPIDPTPTPRERDEAVSVVLDALGALKDAIVAIDAADVGKVTDRVRHAQNVRQQYTSRTQALLGPFVRPARAGRGLGGARG